MTQPRQANGALPNITFMVPVNGTPAAGLGCFAPPSVITWTGTTSTAWDIATANWINTTGSADVYADAIPVTFSDAAATGTVSIAAAVNPGSVTFTNSSLNYAVNSTSLGISGSTGITMTGTGQVTVTGSNTYSGNTTLAGGIYALGADSSTSASTVESPGLTGGTCASLGNASSGVSLSGGAELRLGGRGGTTVRTYIIPNPITIDGGEIVSVDGLQELTGNLTVNSGGASLITSATTKNLYIHTTWSGSGNVVIDDVQGSVSSTSGLVLVDTPSNPYDGIITINGPSTGYLGGILEIGSPTALINASIVNNNTGASGLVFTTATPQIGALSGPGNISLPSSGSLTAGGNGASTTYSGVLSGPGGFIKAGVGVMILSGSNTYTGTTTVTGGILEITGAITSSTSVSIASGAVLYLSGGALNVPGSINNSGEVKLSGSAALSLTGTFINSGVLDLINGPQSLPAKFVNNGTVLNAGSVQVQQLAKSGASGFSLTIQGYTQHTYQLQRATSLSAPVTWTNVGAPQTGSGTPLTFSDPAPTGANGFYQVLVSP
jgi:autotransporter-associated beta strand protein